MPSPESQIPFTKGMENEQGELKGSMNLRNARGIGHRIGIGHRNDERAGSPAGSRGRNLLIAHPLSPR